MKSSAQLLLKIQNEFCGDVIKKNIDRISHEESMVFPSGEANCMNWIFGHLIFVRNALLEMLGEKPVWKNNDFTFYERGVKPLDHVGNFKEFDHLKTYFEESQTRLLSAFEKQKQIPAEKMSDFAALSFHEIYHCGQLGYVRRLLGKEGAIK